MPESPGELDLLRAYLRDRDVTCPACGHNLRGAAGFACPECGARLDLRVTSMDMPHRWWIVCMLAFALPLGLFGTLAGAGAWALAHQRLGRDDGTLLGGCVMVSLFSLLGLALLLKQRTRFIQQGVTWQRLHALTWSAFAAALCAGVMYLIAQTDGIPW